CPGCVMMIVHLVWLINFFFQETYKDINVTIK
ncbi:unnamed protein product, partial [marine sediment metagenome]